MGRPFLPAPADFAEVFEQMGWEAKEAFGMDTPRFKRSISECGGDELKRRRRNYVLGNRLSSLKRKTRVV